MSDSGNFYDPWNDDKLFRKENRTKFNRKVHSKNTKKSYQERMSEYQKEIHEQARVEESNMSKINKNIKYGLPKIVLKGHSNKIIKPIDEIIDVDNITDGSQSKIWKSNKDNLETLKEYLLSLDHEAIKSGKSSGNNKIYKRDKLMLIALKMGITPGTQSKAILVDKIINGMKSLKVWRGSHA
jgi:seryl-tRNA synthetase